MERELQFSISLERGPCMIQDNHEILLKSHGSVCIGQLDIMFSCRTACSWPRIVNQIQYVILGRHLAIFNFLWHPQERDTHVIAFETNIPDIAITARERHNILLYHRNKSIDEGACCNLQGNNIARNFSWYGSKVITCTVNFSPRVHHTSIWPAVVFRILPSFYNAKKRKKHCHGMP